MPLHKKPPRQYDEPRKLCLFHILNAMAMAVLWLGFVSHGFSTSEILDAVYVIQSMSIDNGNLHILPGPAEKFYHDVLMYHGRYFFYWGLSPSILLWLFGKFIGTTAAHYLITWIFFLTFIFFFQRIVQEYLALAVKRSSMPGTHLNFLAIPVTWLLVFVLPFPTTNGWFYSRFIVYEQQILFGLSMAMPALYFLIKAFSKNHFTAYGFSVFFFSLAAFTRVTWFPLALILLSLAPLVIHRQNRNDLPRKALYKGFALLLFSLILMAVIFGLNYLRFESPLDFGVKYQNPGSYMYLHNLKLWFSPLTRVTNMIFNILCYYIPWDWIKFLGLDLRSYSYIEYATPSLFATNPQFIPLLLIIPFGLYKTMKQREPLGVPLIIISSLTVYLNLIIGYFGTMIIMRYFIEFYFFLMLAFFAALLTFIRPKPAVLIISLMLTFHIPGALNGFSKIQPTIRILKPAPAKPGYSFVEKKFSAEPINWPRRILTARNSGHAPFYSLIGLAANEDKDFHSKDIFAVYMIPGVSVSSTKPKLRIAGMKSARKPGTALFFFENTIIGSIELTPQKPVAYSMEIPFTIISNAPYQILVIFLEENTAYLPPRSPDGHVVEFTEMLLETPNP